jgi:hypothetical protein
MVVRAKAGFVLCCISGSSVRAANTNKGFGVARHSPSLHSYRDRDVDLTTASTSFHLQLPHLGKIIHHANEHYIPNWLWLQEPIKLGRRSVLRLIPRPRRRRIQKQSSPLHSTSGKAQMYLACFAIVFTWYEWVMLISVLSSTLINSVRSSPPQGRFRNSLLFILQSMAITTELLLRRRCGHEHRLLHGRYRNKSCIKSFYSGLHLVGSILCWWSIGVVGTEYFG